MPWSTSVRARTAPSSRSHRVLQRRCLVALALLVAVGSGGLAGCSPSAAAKPVVLRIVTDDDAMKPAGKQITHFAAEVKRLSHGTVVVQPKWHAAGTKTDFDQANARLVMSGKDALGLIPSRAWDRLGVTTLRALSTPFLITSDAQVKAAVTGAAAKPMLAGLSAAKVTGISMFPEGLRHPFGVGTPLLATADYRGTIRTPTSATSDAVITALGGTPTSAEVGQGSRGAESEYALAPSGAIATGNVVLFPKVNVLVANSTIWNGLTDDQRTALRGAAATTQAWVDRSLSDDAAATTYCTQGGKVAKASDADIAGLVAAAGSVRAMLERDASTKRIIDALVAEIGPAAPITIPPACATTNAGTSSSALAAMEGTWVVTSTAAQMKKEGTTDPDYINENAGTLVITFHGDSYSWTEIPQQGYSPDNPTGLGDLQEHGGAVTIYWSHAAGENTTVIPRRTADGRLAFTDMTDAGATSDARGLDKVQFQLAGPWETYGKAIAGTWATTVTAADLRAAGGSDMKSAGSATLTLAGGKWTLHRPDGTASGAYTLKDQSIVLTWPGGATTTATAGPNPEGGLTFQNPIEAGSRSAADRAWDGVAFGRAWTKG